MTIGSASRLRAVARIAAERNEEIMRRSPREIFGKNTFIERRWCVFCGEPIEVICTNEFHRYCSQRCSDSARSRRRKEAK